MEEELKKYKNEKKKIMQNKIQIEVNKMANTPSLTLSKLEMEE